MDIREVIEAKKEELGIFQMGWTTTDQLEFMDEVRKLCEVNYCGRYGKTWACPPGVGTLEECKARVMRFENVLVFTTKHDIEDSFDFEGMMDAAQIHGEVCDRTIAAFKEAFGGDIFPMSGEGCSRCEKCTYPDAPCRFPELLAPSAESNGIQVSRVAGKVKVNYINGENTVTYFGMIAF